MRIRTIVIIIAVYLTGFAGMALDGPIGHDYARRFEKAGFVALHFLDNGFRNVTNS